MIHVVYLLMVLNGYYPSHQKRYIRSCVHHRRKRFYLGRLCRKMDRRCDRHINHNKLSFFRDISVILVWHIASCSSLQTRQLSLFTSPFSQKLILSLNIIFRSNSVFSWRCFKALSPKIRRCGRSFGFSS